MDRTETRGGVRWLVGSRKVILAAGLTSLVGCAAVSPSASPAIVSTPSATSSVVAASPTPSAAAQSAAASSSVSSPVSVATAAPGAWSKLSVTAVPAPRPPNGTVVAWKGGDFAIGSVTASGGERAFSSTDGRSWRVLPASTLGFDDPTGNTLFNSAAACGDSIVVETVDGAGHVWLWSSTDLSSWTRTPFHNEGYATLASIGSTLVANVDTGGGAASPAMDVSTDCRTWQRIPLAGPKVAQITSLAASSSGFVAAGESGEVGAPDSKLLAWWSSDGLRWSAASVPSTRGDRIATLNAGAEGFVALETANADVPGHELLLTSSDGHAWKRFNGDPLGTVAEGEGVGSPAGSVTSDGTHLLIYGRKGTSPSDDSAGTAQYWISTDGVHWSRPSIDGPDAHAMLADEYPVPMVLPNGILFAGEDVTWFGAP